MNASPQWICHPEDNRETLLVPIFRKSFPVREGLLKATLQLSAHGLYEAKINGQLVTEEKFCPGLTSYYYRIPYGEYDVTGLLKEGENCWETTVGDGWWRWNYNFGPRLSLWGSLKLEYEGETEIIQTDESFDAGTGPLLRSDLQQGETYDARIAPGSWTKARIEKEKTEGQLIPKEGPEVREKERFPGKLIKDSAGQTVADFGQNLAGYVHMKLFHTKPGQVIHLKHGEALDKSGRFSTANCDGGKSPFQEVTYICRGEEVEEYTPHFTVAGFRYALVEGLEDSMGEFEAIAVYSDMKQTGDFQCSNPLINKLVENARWSQKGNFLDVPVDCPTRERNAWTGDAMIYCRTAAYFMDVYDFFKKWLKDQSIEQYASGKVGITFPSTSSVHDPEEFALVRNRDPRMALAGPSGNGNVGEDSVGWGDSAVWIPCQMYLMYGKKDILLSQYDTAKKWLEYSLSCMRDENPYHASAPWYQEGMGEWIYDTRFHYEEWNEPLPPSKEIIEFFQSGKNGADFAEHFAQFGKPEVATAYTKRSCDNLAQMARVLGKKEDEERYSALSQKIKEAYDRYMIREDGVIQEGHQAAYIRALTLDLVSDEKKPLVIEQLKQELEKAAYHLNTGFLSTVYLLPTLCDLGLIEEAYRILEQEDSPGWLHPILLGATTMLENWDGMDVFRDSFNHYSFGAVCQFLFEYVAGIRPLWEKPGFSEFTLKPVIGGSLTWAKASYETSHGRIESGWEKKEDSLVYSCLVPEGTLAHLTLPDGREEVLPGGTYEFTCNLPQIKG